MFEMEDGSAQRFAESTTVEMKLMSEQLFSPFSFWSDIYTPVIGESEELVCHFQRLKITLDQELQYHRTLQEIKGMLDTILAASQTVQHSQEEDSVELGVGIPTPERTEVNGTPVEMET